MDTATTATETASGQATEGTPGATGAAEGVAEGEGSLAPTEGAAAPAEGAVEGEQPAAASPPTKGKPKFDATARLAHLSKENRRIQQEARAAVTEAAQAREAAEAKAADFEQLNARLRDPQSRESAIDELYTRFGVSFEDIVNREARRGDSTPAQQEASAIAKMQAKLDALEAKSKADEAATVARAEAQARQAHVNGLIATIKADPETYELCARNPQEAADDVLAEVTKAWVKAGKPKLDQGEFDEAVVEALKLTEIRYEERGKRYSKTPKGAKPAAAAAAPAGEGIDARTGLPANLTAGTAKLSERDEDILRGLIDRTAPEASSPRAKPRTIGSGLGGSAPPRAPVNGSMDPRDALREVIAPLTRQTYGM